MTDASAAVVKLALRWWPARKKKFSSGLINDAYDVLIKHKDDQKPVLDVLLRTNYFQNVLYDPTIFDADITNTHLDLILMLSVHDVRIMDVLMAKENQFSLLVERVLSMTVEVGQDGSNYILMSHIFSFLRVLATSRLYRSPAKQLIKDLVVTRTSDLKETLPTSSLRAQWLHNVTMSVVALVRGMDLKDAKPELILFLTEVVRFYVVLDCQLPIRQYIHDFLLDNSVLEIWNTVTTLDDSALELKHAVECLRYSIFYPIDIETGKQKHLDDTFELLQVSLFDLFPTEARSVTDIPSKYDTDERSLATQLAAALNKEQLTEIARSLGLSISASSDIEKISSSISNYALPPNYSFIQYLNRLWLPLQLRPQNNPLFPSAQYMTIDDYINRSIQNGVSVILNKISSHLTQVFDRLGNGFKGKSKYFLSVKQSANGFDIGKSNIELKSWVIVVTWGKANKFSDDLWTSKFGIMNLQLGQVTALHKKLATVEFRENSPKINDDKNINQGIILLPLALQNQLKFYLRFDYGLTEKLRLPGFFYDTFLGFEKNMEVLNYNNINYRLTSIRLLGSLLEDSRPTKKRKSNEGGLRNICYAIEYTNDGDRLVTETDIPGVSVSNAFENGLLESGINPGITVVQSSLSWNNVPQLLKTLHVNFTINLPDERHIIVVPDGTTQLTEEVDIYQDVPGYEEWVLIQIKNRIWKLKDRVRPFLPEYVEFNNIDLIVGSFDAYVDPIWDSWIAGECKDKYPFKEEIQNKDEAQSHYLELVQAFEELGNLRMTEKLNKEQLLRYLRDCYCRTVIVEESKLLGLNGAHFDSVIVWGQGIESFSLNYQLLLTNNRLKRIILIGNEESADDTMYLRLISMGVSPFSIEYCSESVALEANPGFSCGKGYVHEPDAATTTQYSIKEVQMCAALYRYMINKGYLSADIVIMCCSPVHVQLIEQNYPDVRAILYSHNLAQFKYVIWSSFGAAFPFESAMAGAERKAMKGFYVVNTTSAKVSYTIPKLELCPDENLGSGVGGGARRKEGIESMQQFIDEYLE